jgi:hypothetical protein
VHGENEKESTFVHSEVDERDWDGAHERSAHSSVDIPQSKRDQISTPPSPVVKAEQRPLL